VRTTVDIPEPLLRNAKTAAEKRGITLSRIVEDALQRHLSKKAPASGPPFRLHTVKGRLVIPHLDLDRTSALDIAADEEAFAAPRNR